MSFISPFGTVSTGFNMLTTTKLVCKNLESETMAECGDERVTHPGLAHNVAHTFVGGFKKCLLHRRSCPVPDSDFVAAEANSHNQSQMKDFGN